VAHPDRDSVSDGECDPMTVSVTLTVRV